MPQFNNYMNYTQPVYGFVNECSFLKYPSSSNSSDRFITSARIVVLTNNVKSTADGKLCQKISILFNNLNFDDNRQPSLKISINESKI